MDARRICGGLALAATAHTRDSSAHARSAATNPVRQTRRRSSVNSHCGDSRPVVVRRCAWRLTIQSSRPPELCLAHSTAAGRLRLDSALGAMRIGVQAFLIGAGVELVFAWMMVGAGWGPCGPGSPLGFIGMLAHMFPGMILGAVATDLGFSGVNAAVILFGSQFVVWSAMAFLWLTLRLRRGPKGPEDAKSIVLSLWRMSPQFTKQPTWANVHAFHLWLQRKHRPFVATRGRDVSFEMLGAWLGLSPTDIARGT